MSHILFIDETAEIGGAQVNLLLLVKELVCQGWRVDVILPQPGPVVEKLKHAGAAVKFIPSLPWYSVSFYFLGKYKLPNPLAILAVFAGGLIWSWRLMSFIGERRPDIIQTVSMWGHAWGGFAARLLKIPCVAHFQDIVGNHTGFGLFRLLVNTWGAVIPQKIICISQPVAGQFYGMAKNKTQVLLNTVDVDKFSPAPVQKNSAEFHLGTVARITRWKGHAVILKTAALLKAQGLPFHWRMIGNTALGSEIFMTEMKKMIIKHGLQAEISFEGWHDDMPRLYRSLDLLVHLPTEPEPFGLVLAEAMACGLPVVAVKGSGADELVECGGGILVPPVQPKAAAQAITQLWEDPEDRARRGKQARKMSEHHFGIQRYIENWLMVYKGLGL